LSVVSDFLEETLALAPAEQIPKLLKQIERMQKLMDHIQEKNDELSWNGSCSSSS
jgi:hypothetical protein